MTAAQLREYKFIADNEEIGRVGYLQELTFNQQVTERQRVAKMNGMFKWENVTMEEIK